MKNAKKKGFTLIELIAVIAIIGILAAIIVPNIINYTNAAKESKAVSDAKTIVGAVDAYNATQDGSGTAIDTSTSLLSNSNKPLLIGTDKLIKSWPTEFVTNITTYTQLETIADKNNFISTTPVAGSGKWTVDTNGDVECP